MEKYRGKIKWKTAGLVGIAVLLVIAYCIVMLNKNKLPEMTEHLEGFFAGVVTGLEFVLLFWISKNLRAIKNEDILQKLYIKENDERNALILQRTGSSLLPICSVAFGVAAAIGAFFNIIVFFTLLGAICFMALVKIVLLLYYKWKF